MLLLPYLLGCDDTYPITAHTIGLSAIALFRMNTAAKSTTDSPVYILHPFIVEEGEAWQCRAIATPAHEKHCLYVCCMYVQIYARDGFTCAIL